MSLALVFNHHSLPYENKQDADLGVQCFIKTALACRQYGFNLMLIDVDVDKSWFRIQLAPDYYWHDWFQWAKSQARLKDVVRAFRSLQTRQPMLLASDEQAIDASIEVGLVQQDHGLSVLQVAYWYKTFLISFPVGTPWNQTLIKVWVLNLQDDHESNTEVDIKNLFDDASLQIHKNSLKALRDKNLKAGKDIWENREVFFPNLCLLDNKIGEQLRGWSHRVDILNKAKDALLVMEVFVQKWQEGVFDDYRHENLISCGLAAEVSGESSSVKDSRKKKAEREFWLPMGRKVFCENHVKLPDGFRLHFYAASDEKKIYVAYLGVHLTL